MEEAGRRPGEMKLLLAGGSIHTLGRSGSEKSLITLLKRIPVRDPIFIEPNLHQSTEFFSHQKNTGLWYLL